MGRPIYESCSGCNLSYQNYLCNDHLNYDSSCPCIDCLVKMMNCDTNPAMNYSCDKWMNWFRARYREIKGKGIEEF